MSDQNQTTQQIKLELTVDQVNQILQALGNEPFQKVYALIRTIQQQAQSQLEGGQEDLLHQ